MTTEAHRDFVPDQFLVVGDSRADRNAAVENLLTDQGLTIKHVDSDRGPDRVALIQLDLDSGSQVDFVELRERHPKVFPNYVVVPMVHARVLPINYPRPASVPPGFTAPRQPATGAIDVVVIDSALIDGSPMADGVDVTDHDHGPLDLGHVDESVGINHVHDHTKLSDLHGTFVTSIIQQLEPRARVRLMAMDNRDGDGFYSDWELACQLMRLGADVELPDIVNLSLGVGPIDGTVFGLGADERPRATQLAIEALHERAATGHRQVFVLAAAGNDGGPEPVYPAAFDNVHAVGAQISLAGGRPRPAHWSNGVKSDKVRFWAPGVSIRGATITHRDVSFPPLHELDTLDAEHADDLPMAQHGNLDFDGWAFWDGTSFATPIVAARLAAALIANTGLEDVDADFGSPGNASGFPGGSFEAP